MATVMLKEGKEVVSVPSWTLIVILEVVPILASVGVPERAPDDVSRFAQMGLFVMLNETVSPSASLKVGEKE